MRTTKNIIFIGVVTIVILAQFYYLFTSYKQDKETIAANRQEIASVQQDIDQLEERLVMHEESKKELARLEMQKTALLDTIPSQTQNSKFMSNMMNNLSLMDYMNLRVVDNGVETIENEIGKINKRTYEIMFTSTYTTSKKLIEHIAGMYQAANISQYNFNAGIQETAAEDMAEYYTLFGDDFYEIGETTFKLTVFYRVDGSISDEVYQPGVSGRASTEPFKNNKLEVAETSTSIPTDISEIPPIDVAPITELPESDSQFLISIGDILSSGDTYKLSGPGEDDTRYVGIISDTNATMTLSVYDDHYELSVEDEKDQVEQTTIYIPIKTPTLRIISTMREVQTVMPNVHINVYNYSSDNMKISIEGTLLDNIHIFNEKGQEVAKGQTKGKISLT